MFFKENVLSNIYIRYEIVDLDFGKLDTLEIFEFPGASPLAIERHYFCSSETTFRGDRDQHTHREALVKKKKKKNSTHNSSTTLINSVIVDLRVTSRSESIGATKIPTGH